ncbi:MAG: translation elongation factor Ts [Fuerstiella sp.]|nr:translation elongation factor Ts [Fuerstiella sp.]
MSEITAASVKALRERTDLPMMECKKALVEAEGDMEKAVEILKAQFRKIQDKRADNATEEGRIFFQLSDDGKQAAMVEIQCESAPVATGQSLSEFGSAMVSQLLNGPGAESPEELMSQCTDNGTTLQSQFEELVNKIREKIVVNRVERVSGPVGGYVHHDGKTGVLFQATGENSGGILRDVAMHIAALRPSVTRPEDVDASLVQQERDRLSEEARATGKPDNIIDKIVDGRMKNFFVEQGVLLAQPFAKDDSKTVEKALTECGLEAVGFHRWQVGGAADA